jgi:hypothetical protein
VVRAPDGEGLLRGMGCGPPSPAGKVRSVISEGTFAGMGGKEENVSGHHQVASSGPRSILNRAAPLVVSVGRRRELPQLFLQQIKVHRLSEEVRGAEVVSSAATLVVAVGGHHHHREVGKTLLDPFQEL